MFSLIVAFFTPVDNVTSVDIWGALLANVNSLVRICQALSANSAKHIAFS
jgi:hypothetical protein